MDINGNGKTDVTELRLDGGFLDAIAREQDRDRANMNARFPSASVVQPMHQYQLDHCLADGVLKRIAWKLPQAATQKMWKISLSSENSSDKAEKIRQDYAEYHRRLKTRQKVRKALELARAYGGACLVLFVNDGNHHSQPINYGKIKSVDKIVVRHRFQIEPDPMPENEAYRATDLDDVTHYRLLGVDDRIAKMFKQTQQREVKIHSDRVIRFDGARMADDWMLNRNQGWGLSCFDEIYSYYKGYRNGLEGCRELIRTHSTLQQSIEGLRKMIQGSSEQGLEAVKKAAKSLRLLYDLYGMVLTDSKEQISWNARPVAGMDALINVLRDAFIGVSGQPHTILFGESPGGLGRDGKETQVNWSHTVSEYQEEHLEPALAYLDDILFATKDGPTKGKPLDDYERKYPSIMKMTLEDVRSGRVSDIQALSSAIQSQFLTADEARSVPRNPDWWEELALDDDAWEKQKQEQEQQGQQQGIEEYQDPYGAEPGMEGQLPPEEGQQPQITEEELYQLLAQQQQQAKQDSFVVDLNLGDRTLWDGDIAEYKRKYLEKYGSLENAYD